MSIKCTWLREANDANGNPGPFSFRRVEAFILLLASLGFFVFGLLLIKDIAVLLKSIPDIKIPIWLVFIPGGACLLGAIVLPILTTIADLASLVQAVKK